MDKKNKKNFFFKTKNLSNIYLSILFILTFLLIFFNKTDYLIINQIKSTGFDIINPISKVISFPISTTIKTINSINDLRFAKQENIILKEEIIRLKKWQTLSIKNLRENKAYKKLLNSTSNNMNVVKTAIVIAQSPEIYSKTIVINAGKNHQIDNNFAVINERGLVGRVLSVSNNNSNILLINDVNSSIPVKLMDQNFFAIMSGTRNGKYLISAFVKDEKIPNIGDILVTSGNANIFPQDILVGKIINITDKKIIALPFADLRNIEFVQVINNR